VGFVVLWVIALIAVAIVGVVLNPPAIWYGWGALFVVGLIVIILQAFQAGKDAAHRAFH